MIDRWETWSSDAVGDITLVAPTVSRLLGAEPPKGSTATVMQSVLDAAAAVNDGKPIERLLFFAPDAMGAFLYRDRPELFQSVEKLLPLQVRLTSVMPSKTPVCFTSMFTGKAPAEHGITEMNGRTYSDETLFDALINAGKRLGLAATYGGCMDHFWRERKMEYSIQQNPPAVSRATLELIAAKQHDVVFSYYSGYDGIIHRAHPVSDEAISVATDVISDFEEMVAAFHRAWPDRSRAIVFAPDHGAHYDAELGTGTHGTELPDDMNLIHFFGLFPAGDR